MSHISGKIIENMSVNCVIFGFSDNTLKIVLVKRSNSPFMGEWALPGGFLLIGEEPDTSSERVLHETTGVKEVYMEQVETFGGVNRFPDKHVFSIGYYALVKPEMLTFSSGIDTDDVKWFDINKIPTLPFDHENIISKSLEKLRNKIKIEPIIFDLLNDKFTIPQIQSLYEGISGNETDRRNFRKRLLRNKLVIDLDEKDTNNTKRAAKLYSFNRNEYYKIIEEGYIFSF